MTSVNYYAKYLKYKKKYLTLVDEINGGCQANQCTDTEVCIGKKCVARNLNSGDADKGLTKQMKEEADNDYLPF